MVRSITLVGAILCCALRVAAQTVEIREEGRVFALSSGPDDARLLLRVDGHEVPLGQCADEQQGQSLSRGGVTALVLERNCGATVDFATHVQLLFKGKRESVAVFAGRVPVQCVWTTAGLTVRHAPLSPDRIYQRAAQAFGSRVIYEAVGSRAAPSQHVAFSSFNYGATGRAAGVPAEVLLRAAGWSQQASGLYRPSWGTWQGGPPYGDDAEGSAQVVKGIDYEGSKSAR